MTTRHEVSQAKHREESEPAPAKPAKEEIIMKHVFTQLIDISEKEIHDFRKVNSQKELVLKEHNKTEKGILGTIFDDKPNNDYLSGDVIIKNGIAIKVARITVGKNVGPAGYNTEVKEMAKNTSTNIKTMEEFKKIVKKSPVNLNESKISKFYKTNGSRKNININTSKNQSTYYNSRTPSTCKGNRSCLHKTTKSIGNNKEIQKSNLPTNASSPWSAKKAVDQKRSCIMGNRGNLRKNVPRMNILEKVTQLAEELNKKNKKGNNKCDIVNFETVSLIKNQNF